MWDHFFEPECPEWTDTDISVATSNGSVRGPNIVDSVHETIIKNHGSNLAVALAYVEGVHRGQ